MIEVVNMSIDWPMIIAILVPNVGGWLSGLFMIGEASRPDGKAWYQLLKKPSWTPPRWLFGPIWTTLYTCMGYASYRIYQGCGGFTEEAYLPLGLYATQLVLNLAWNPVFFKLHKIAWALVNLCVLEGVNVVCFASFFYVDKMAALLLAPYIAFLVFATSLNYAVWRLNIEPSYGVMDEEKPTKY